LVTIEDGEFCEEEDEGGLGEKDNVTHALAATATGNSLRISRRRSRFARQEGLPVADGGDWLTSRLIRSGIEPTK